MEHNVYNFVIQCSLINKFPRNVAKPAINYYLKSTIQDMPHKQSELVKISTFEDVNKSYLTCLELTIRDYGVNIVGVGIISKFVMGLYKDDEFTRGFSIDSIIVLKKGNKHGALVTWDVFSDQLIIKNIDY